MRRPRFRLTLLGAFGLLTVAAIGLAVAHYYGDYVLNESRRRQEANDVKHAALLLHYYHDTQRRFPAAKHCDKIASPVRSWRVEVVPFVCEVKLRDNYNDQLPWNSSANDALCRAARPLYLTHQTADAKPPFTNVVMPTGPGTVGEAAISFSDVKDGTANTILLLALKPSDILWYEPRDLDLSEITRAPGDPHRILIRGKLFQDTLCAFCDGRVAMLPANLDYDTFIAMLTIAGGENIDVSRFHSP
jgi:hypothetical protein